MSTAADLLAEQMVADAAAQMLGAESVTSGGSGPTSADMAAAMAMAAAAGLSPEEMAELAGGSAPPATSAASSSVSEADYAALVSRAVTPGSRLKQERSLSLALRTSLLCEFRVPSGLLQAFEVCYGQTTFGVLCMALSRMPGLEFIDHQSHSWFKRPSHFVFKGELYEVSIPYDNIRIAPVEYGKAVIEMEELLEYVRHNVLRAHASRYTIR